MLKLLKKCGVSILEKHPYGYALGLFIMESSSFFLPHENDFYAMPLIPTDKSSGLFLDIGANRGHSSLGFNKIMPGWETIAIEANPLHCKRLDSLKKKMKLTHYHIVAADAVSGNTVTLWTPSYRNIFCHSSSAVDIKEAIRSIELSFPKQLKKFNYISHATKTLALDDLNLAPHIVKIDIQGKEIDAIRGLKKTIDRHRPAFLIECNLDGENILDFLRTLNYLPYVYNRKHHRLDAANHGLDLSNGRNIFFIPAEKAENLQNQIS